MAKEKKLVRKLDVYLVPIIMSLYIFSFLDRVNIGNARLYHMESDLGLQGNQYQIAVSILFVTYVTFEVPSNLVLKKFTPSRWIAFITTAWGIIATLTGLVNSYGALITCRVLLGAVEAGLFPGLNIYLTFFYTKHELALRVGYLFVSAAIAGALGGLLAYGIGHMDGVAGMSGWRWIMIIEGLPTVCLGIITFFALPNEAETAYFLNREEKNLQVARHAREYGVTQDFKKEDAWKAFKDWKTWAFCVGQFGVDNVLYGYSTFLPTIINGLGKWTTAQVQLLTIPCYFLGAATYMLVARLSDRMQMRGLMCVIFGSVSVVGYGVLISASSAGVHYFGCFLIAMGLYVTVGLPLAWLPNNAPRYGKRTTANGMQLTVGNCAGILAPFIYPTAEGPRYVKGNAISLSLVGLSSLIFGFMWFWYSRKNRERQRGDIPAKYQGLSDDELAALGDESPHFSTKMGIKQLFSIIKEEAPDAIKEKEIKNQFGRKVAIDASMSIYSFLIAVRSDGQQLTNESGETTSHLMGMFYRTLRMVDNGIKPLYVFDGAPPKLKSGELAKRFQRKQEATEGLEEAKETGTAEDVEKFSRRTVRVTREHNAECQRLLRLMGIPYIVAPTEAEAQCAVLARAGKVYAAASEDMDTLCFDTPILLRHLTFSEQRKEPIQEIHTDKVLEGLNMDRKQFVDLCILLGCDYLDPIPKVGPSTALKLIRDHGSLEKVVEFIKNDPKSKYQIPEDWPFEDARDLFFSPDVRQADDPLCDFKWDKPDMEGLVQFLVHEKGFSDDRVRAGGQRLEKNLKSTQQSRIEGFFKVMPKTEEEKKAHKRKLEEQHEVRKKKLKEEKKEKAKAKAKPRGTA
ncbi:putative high-affinity nicotinic acid transporter [Diplogelasinospora grovesii]|uniref:Flap endonuclease 1 n=1 Tax=Diplogelasinospora grovesii TaxID=303347 RepID=A0AAN6S4Y3_9PEZI|nr:putative high-affinity nicotinic acid transporter [Diplogelasinospora grovesii]